jgi:quinol-cytochrome oxidoreductase complex cytochrome b subunit
VGETWVFVSKCDIFGIIGSQITIEQFFSLSGIQIGLVILGLVQIHLLVC